VAFAREHNNEWIVVLAPRLTARVGSPATGERWQDTTVELPQASSSGGAGDLFTGRDLRVEGGALKLSEAMAVLPFAIYTNIR
jgi:maltooligosyltrehalose synthase